MDGVRRYHVKKISQSEKDKYGMISLMWNLRNKTDENWCVGEKRGKPENKLLTIENKLRVTGGEVEGWLK